MATSSSERRSTICIACFLFKHMDVLRGLRVDLQSMAIRNFFHRFCRIMLPIKVASSSPKFKGEAGPECSVATISVKIPTGATGDPDGAFHPLLHFGIICFLALRLHFDRLYVFFIHHMHTIEDI